ncbi:MAG TPA: DUF4340 domain-containing protein [Candidatus Binatia bacterium]
MRRLNTLILAVLLIALGGYVYFFELAKDEKGKSERLINFKSDELTGIDLAYPKRALQLQKDPSGKWRLTQPLQTGADDAAVGSLIAAITAADIKRPLEKKPSAEDLKSFGLDTPAAKVSLTLKSGLTLPQLIVGAKTPLGDSAYVRRGSDPVVYLTGSALVFALDKEPNEIRDRTIVVFPVEKATRLQIQTTGQALVLAKGEKEEWTIESPLKKTAKADAVNGYFALLAQLRAKTFADDHPADLKKYGLDRAALEISIDGKDGKNLARLRVAGKSAVGYYATAEGSPTVYTIDERFYNQLRKQPADFAAEEKEKAKK